MDGVIMNLKNKYNMTDKDIENICPEFDIKQVGNHKQVAVSMHGYVFEIDEKIEKLFRLINKYDINTTQSCQHNLLGWCGFTFTAIGYHQFVNTLYNKAKVKYTNEEIYNMSVFKRFMFDTKDNNKMRAYCELFDGETEFSLNISYNFKQSEIVIIEKELEELLE